MFKASILGISLVAMLCGFTQADVPKKPNIVFILADDLGWADTLAAPHPFYETPNIDRMQREGMTFTSAYTCGPNCAPTRASLMTGMYTPRHHLYTPGGLSKGELALMKLKVPSRKGGPKFEIFESLDNYILGHWTSIAEVLNPVGYTTACYGKWHLGQDTQGFDHFASDGKTGIDERHYGSITIADELADAGVEFIEQNRDGPFFLYLAHFDVHTPIRAKREVVARYQQKLMDGEKWNPTYAGMIEAVDKSVGRIRDKLRELKIDDDTLVIFSSDNGGLPMATRNAPLRGGKGSLFEGGIRIPTCVAWTGVIEPGSSCDTPIISVDFMPTIAELAGAELPSTQPVDGASIAPLLAGEPALADRAIFWHYPLYLSGGQGGKVLPVAETNVMYWRAVPASAIRRGDWKLIHYFEDNSVKLFNVTEDISERHDLSEQDPERAQELLTQLRRWQQATEAPIPTELNPKFDPSRAKKIAKAER